MVASWDLILPWVPQLFQWGWTGFAFFRCTQRFWSYHSDWAQLEMSKIFYVRDFFFTEFTEKIKNKSLNNTFFPSGALSRLAPFHSTGNFPSPFESNMYSGKANLRHAFWIVATYPKHSFADRGIVCWRNELDSSLLLHVMRNAVGVWSFTVSLPVFWWHGVGIWWDDGMGVFHPRPDESLRTQRVHSCIGQAVINVMSFDREIVDGHWAWVSGVMTNSTNIINTSTWYVI